MYNNASLFIRKRMLCSIFCPRITDLSRIIVEKDEVLCAIYSISIAVHRRISALTLANVNLFIIKVNSLELTSIFSMVYRVIIEKSQCISDIEYHLLHFNCRFNIRIVAHISL
jgi:hypothetical protein